MYLFKRREKTVTVARDKMSKALGVTVSRSIDSATKAYWSVAGVSAHRVLLVWSLAALMLYLTLKTCRQKFVAFR